MGESEGTRLEEQEWLAASKALFDAKVSEIFRPAPPMTPPKTSEEELGEPDMLRPTILRVILPTVLAFIGGAVVYAPSCVVLQDMLDIGNTGRGPILSLLGMDQSQFMQNFLTVNGLLFTILCGNTYTALYNQQERLFHALFHEVSEAKSLLEQACLVCQGRPFYPRILESIGDYVANDLCRLDAEPADLLANRPMDDPLEYILYATSVGVPSTIYDTIRDLRQARGQRLGAMQRKLPAIHFVLLYILGILELLAFPLLGAGAASVSREPGVLSIQAVFFGAMCGAIVMTLQVIFELWKPFGGAYTVDIALRKMVLGIEEELKARRALWNPNFAASDDSSGWHMDRQYYQIRVESATSSGRRARQGLQTGLPPRPVERSVPVVQRDGPPRPDVPANLIPERPHSKGTLSFWPRLRRLFGKS